MTASSTVPALRSAPGTGTPSDIELIHRQRWILAQRPELRWVYQQWFARLLGCAAGSAPVIEVGSGPGLLKEHAPHVIATDLTPGAWLDLACDACALPFRSGTVGALVMVDVLHHLPHPLAFLDEAARVLRPGGRLAMIEPWITPVSFLLYRYLHHEACDLAVDLDDPFAGADKKAFDGNAAIPFRVLDHLRRRVQPFRVIRRDAFLGLPYLVTLGFKCERRLPWPVVAIANASERVLGPVGRLAATRVLLVLETSPGATPA